LNQKILGKKLLMRISQLPGMNVFGQGE